MSHPATLSPSPIHFGDPSTSNFYRFASAASDNLPSFFERRRTSHPHNQHSQRASEEMPERSQSQQRPRLEHQASQTVIDLTSDHEDAPAPQRNQTRVHRPPQLGRSDAVSLGDLIDLTDDGGEIEIMITGERRAPVQPRPRSRLRPPVQTAFRDDSPPLFVPAAPQIPPPHAHVQVMEARRNSLAAMIGQHRVEFAAAALDHHHFPGFHVMGGHHFMHQLQNQAPHQHQPMPGILDYHQPAWPNAKPQHVAPPPAQDNFTRSPTEADVVICPSCEKELVHEKDAEEPLPKKGGRAPSRKDREEHPFWVVKECGHVYCNSCYQLRALASKHTQIAFQEYTISPRKKGLKCAVDECGADVKAKEKWVGVFL